MHPSHRRKGPGALLLPLVVACVALPRPSQAEPLSLNLRGFSPSTSPEATLSLEPSSTSGHLNFNGAAWLSWARRPLTAKRDGEIVGAVVDNQLSTDLAMSLGLGKRAEVGLVVPAVLYQSGDAGPEVEALRGAEKVPAAALGDVQLTGKANLVPIKELGGFGLAGLGRVGLPTGSTRGLLGEGAVTSELRLLAELRLLGLSLLGTTGFKLRTEERTLGSKTWGDEIPWGIGVQLRPQMLGWDAKNHWTWTVESHGALPAGPDAPFASAAQAPVFVGASARYALRDVSVLGGVESSVTGAAGAPVPRVVAAVTWAPREHDRDHDGLDDELDECPDLAEDRDNLQDSDGCPEADADDDGVVDEEDRCPLVPEDDDGFDDEDGCPDPDNDQDGILDKDDACPNEKGAPDLVRTERHGCPDRDSDADGVEEPADKCPTEQEDRDGFEDEDGCPDPDNDQDGILDKDDACANVKGLPSEDPKLHGCPSPDRDGDGIANDVDKCPDEAETYDGRDDDDGCPEVPDKKHKPLVTVVEKKGARQLELVPIKFVARDGAELDGASKAALRAVGQLLLREKGARVEVAVRPSPQGGDALAKARGEAAVAIIRAVTGKRASASVVTWVRGQTAPRAEVSGVSVLLVSEAAK